MPAGAEPPNVIAVKGGCGGTGWGTWCKYGVGVRGGGGGTGSDKGWGRQKNVYRVRLRVTGWERGYGRWGKRKEKGV